MRKAILTIAIVFSIAIAGSALAQPNIMVYFDEGNIGAANCPDGPLGSVVDTLYVVANNLDMWISAVEFQVVLPTQLYWLGDTYDTDLHIGDSQVGLSLAWNVPKNAFGSTVLMSMTVIWYCNSCDGNQDTPIDVIPNPNQGYLRAVQWPDGYTVDAQGMRSLLCATTPVESTTWGQIKSLYK